MMCSTPGCGKQAVVRLYADNIELLLDARCKLVAMQLGGHEEKEFKDMPFSNRALSTFA